MECLSKGIRIALLWLTELSTVERDFLIRRTDFISDLYQAQLKLDNFNLSISVKHKNPKFWEIRFAYTDLGKYETLKKYTGKYGFVVPTMWSKTKRILRGEKRLKYSI